MPKAQGRPDVPPRYERKKQPQKMSKGKSRILKVLTYIGITLLLLIPTYLAITGYLLKKNAPVETVETYYTGLELTGPTGYFVTAAPLPSGVENEKSQLFDTFLSMLEHSLYTTGIPETHENGVYQLKMLTNTGMEQYTFYFSATDGAACYTNSSGIIYRTADNGAEPFLNSVFAYELYADSTPPVLTTAATDRIIPSELEWSYRTKDGTFSNLIHTATTNELLTYPIANDVGFSFSLKPTSYTLTIRKGSEEIAHSGDLENVSLSQLTQGEILDFEIDATYSQDGRYNYNGRAVYRFRMVVVEAASFALDTTTNPFGNYFLLSCQNVRNEQNLQITAEPALQSAPLVFKRGEMVYAAIPADQVGARRLTVTYGTINGSFDLTVTERSGTADLTLAASDLREGWQILENNRLNGYIAEYGAATDNTLFTPLGTFGTPGASAVRRIAFGDRMTITDTAVNQQTLPFELYEMSGAVSALSHGYVLHVNTDAAHPLGKFVILDHGGGLYTWYCGLSDIPVALTNASHTRYVAKGDTVGIAGQTGCGPVHTDSVLILATWGKTAIAPQYLREYAPTLTAE